jgi:transglutaminase-like putative cysteine protease
VTDKAVYKLLGATNTVYKGNGDAPSNKIYIRLADVLLWKAEAYNETGSYSQAIAIINTIRNRARTSVTVGGTLPPAGTLPDRIASVDKALIKSWLVHERRVELGFESQRFNDLKRWKIAAQVLTPAIGKNFKAFNYLYPIPQGEIDKSGGSITQNPGY